MNSTTSSRRRSSARAAAVATIAAVIFGAAACGSETVSDNGKAPAAPPAKVQAVPHQPMSADAAARSGASVRRAAAQLQDGYVRHLLYVAKQRRDEMKLHRQVDYATGHHREIARG